MSARRHYKDNPTNRDPRTLAFDFGAAKGTGASVVIDPDFVVKPDPDALIRIFELAEAERRGKRRKNSFSHRQISVAERLRKLRVDRTHALQVAYRIAVAHTEKKPIPHELRIAIANTVLNITEDNHLANRILNADFDDHLHELLR